MAVRVAFHQLEEVEGVLMISHDAMPIGHTSPYERIDTMHPGRKAVITLADLARSGDRLPDLAAYRFDCYRREYILKDGQ